MNVAFFNGDARKFLEGVGVEIVDGDAVFPYDLRRNAIVGDLIAGVAAGLFFGDGRGGASD